MTVYYFNIDGEKGDKIVSLMANLSENFGVTVKDALMVETDLDFLRPMLEKLGEESQVKVADGPSTSAAKSAASAQDAKKRVRREKAAAGEWEGKPCPECGATIGVASVMGFCSKRCYMMDYRRKRKEKKPKVSEERQESMRLPNQAQVDQKRVEEEARIEAVVAKAKMNAPSADFLHTIKAGGSIMARKL